MNFKKIVAYQYALEVYQEIYNRKMDKKVYYQTVLQYNNQLLTAKAYQAKTIYDDTEFPIIYSLKNLNNVIEVADDFSNEQSNSIFVRLRHLVFKKFGNSYSFEAFQNHPNLVLEQLSIIVEELDFSELIVPEFYLFDVNFLETKVSLPFLKTNSEDSFEIVSLVSKN